MSDLIDRQAAIDDIWTVSPLAPLDREWIDRWLRQLPSAQPEQLEQCPIYGGMCAYPSDQCYDCPRHAGAKMESEVTT